MFEAQDAIVTETYTYAGRGGRVSNRQTRLWGYTFDLGVTCDILGNVETLSYPSCPHARCDAPPRTVSFGYTQGGLTTVPGYTSSITYHANGLVNQVVHTNGITDTQTTDASGIAYEPRATYAINWPTATGKAREVLYRQNALRSVMKRLRTRRNRNEREKARRRFVRLEAKTFSFRGVRGRPRRDRGALPGPHAPP